MIQVTTQVYRDRSKFEPWCFNTENDGLVGVHRFELKATAEQTRASLVQLYGVKS